MNTLRLATWLRERGSQIVLYALDGSILWQKAAEAGIATRHIRSTFKHGDVVNAHRLAKMLTADKIRILVLHERRHIMLTALTKLGCGPNLKLVYVQHMHIGVDKKDLYHSWLYGHLDSWIVPLEILKERLRSKTRFDPAKVAVIPFGIELDRFTKNLPAKSEARTRLGLPQDATIVGVVGRLEPEKCQETLIKAGAILHKSGRPVHLLIVGDETLHEKSGYAHFLKNLARESNLADSTHFRPAMSNVADVYAALDIFTLTSKSETYGMVTIEAMSSGLPVIGTRHGGTREIIDHGVNGLLVEREAPEELADALRRLLEEPQLAAKLGDQALHGSIKYSHHTQCELMERLFVNLEDSEVDSG